MKCDCPALSPGCGTGGHGQTAKLQAREKLRQLLSGRRRQMDGGASPHKAKDNRCAAKVQGHSL